jgi:hypothetical protein
MRLWCLVGSRRRVMEQVFSGRIKRLQCVRQNFDQSHGGGKHRRQLLREREQSLNFRRLLWLAVAPPQIVRHRHPPHRLFE